jgi:hypothetical protein
MWTRRDTEAIEITQTMVYNGLAFNDLHGAVRTGLKALARALTLVFIDINLHCRSSNKYCFDPLYI